MVISQQQLRQKMADVIQQLRTEMNETFNDRIDMLSSINTALQHVAAKPAASKPYRINDLIPGAMTREKLGTSCRTHTCMRGQTKEKRCLSALKALTSLRQQHLQWIVLMMSSEQFRRHLTNPAQNSKRTTENGTANTRTGGFRSMARDREEIGSEEHVRHKLSTCSTGQ